MALIKCERCGHMISNKAKKCPSCTRKKHENISFSIALCLFAIVIIIMIVAFISK